MGNPVSQFQIISTAPDQTASFYSALFGWKVDASNPMGYRKIDTGSDLGIQGGIWPAPPQAPTFVQMFIDIQDVKAAAARAVELGAKIIIPPTRLPEGEDMAVLQDPQGMSFGLYHKS